MIIIDELHALTGVKKESMAKLIGCSPYVYSYKITRKPSHGHRCYFTNPEKEILLSEFKKESGTPEIDELLEKLRNDIDKNDPELFKLYRLI